jgi:signal transduction histidine kinase
VGPLVERGSGPACADEVGVRAHEIVRQGRRAAAEAQAEDVAATLRTPEALLRRAALAIGEFAALVAHETNQPIAATLLNCAAARNHLREPDADLTPVRECIERIERDVKRAGAVIQRIRSLMTNSQLEYTALDLNPLIEEALCFLDHELAQAGVVVTKTLHPDLPLVLGDRVQLEQVLINLYSNAIESMRSTPAGTRTLTVGTGLEDQRPCVSVRDTGPGVEPQALDRLFEPLFTTKSGGIGLGLSISRSIVEAHGGQLWTTAGPSAGGCFCFTVQAAPQQADVGAAPSRVAKLSAPDVAAVAVDPRGVRGA